VAHPANRQDDDGPVLVPEELIILHALLDVLTERFGPDFAEAVRQNVLNRADRIETDEQPVARKVAFEVREIAAWPMWERLTARGLQLSG
jgi:hypothetical protein